MRARLIDQEGVVWAEIAIPKFVHSLDVAVAPNVVALANPTDPVTLHVDKVTFDFEQCADDGTLIYRRVTPLWTDD